MKNKIIGINNENKEEIIQVMDDLRSAEVDFLTIGQYLQPSVKHHPLHRYYHPNEFKDYGLSAFENIFTTFKNIISIKVTLFLNFN